MIDPRSGRIHVEKLDAHKIGENAEKLYAVVNGALTAFPPYAIHPVPPYGFLRGFYVHPISKELLPNMDAANLYRLLIALYAPNGQAIPLDVVMIADQIEDGRGTREPREPTPAEREGYRVTDIPPPGERFPSL